MTQKYINGRMIRLKIGKRSLVVFLALLLLPVLPVQALALDEPQIRIFVNGSEIAPDVPPFIEDGRTMVPIRFIAEALGAYVNWVDSEMTDYIQLDVNKTLSIPVDQPLPNGLGTAALVNDRLFVPIRYVAEQMGATVDWNASTQTVTIIR